MRDGLQVRVKDRAFRVESLDMTVGEGGLSLGAEGGFVLDADDVVDI
jgi:hypothetical protein